MITTHIKTVKHSMLCVAGVCLRDINDMTLVILHLNVSRLFAVLLVSSMLTQVNSLLLQDTSLLSHRGFLGESYRSFENLRYLDPIFLSSKIQIFIQIANNCHQSGYTGTSIRLCISKYLSWDG